MSHPDQPPGQDPNSGQGATPYGPPSGGESSPQNTPPGGAPNPPGIPAGDQSNPYGTPTGGPPNPYGPPPSGQSNPYGSPTGDPSNPYGATPGFSPNPYGEQQNPYGGTTSPNPYGPTPESQQPYGATPQYGTPPQYGAAPQYGSQPSAYPPGGPPGPYSGYPASQGTSGLAIASMVCSLLGICCVLLALPGVILGHVALSQISRQGGGGRGMAIAGLVIGYLLILLNIVLLATGVTSEILRTY